jgi:hypothetical protein
MGVEYARFDRSVGWQYDNTPIIDASRAAPAGALLDFQLRQYALAIHAHTVPEVMGSCAAGARARRARQYAELEVRGPPADARHDPERSSAIGVAGRAANTRCRWC